MRLKLTNHITKIKVLSCRAKTGNTNNNKHKFIQLKHKNCFHYETIKSQTN